MFEPHSPLQRNLKENISSQYLEVERFKSMSSVNGSWGFGCGTGLTWKDTFAVPARYQVSLKGRGQTFQAQGEVTAPLALLLKTRAKKKVMKFVKSLPNCSW